MNKKIIALAVAAAFTAPMAAQAAVTTYGHAQVEVSSFGGDAGNGQAVADNARGRIGFKASEDLGNGMKALAKFEFKVDTADGDAGTATDTTDTVAKVDAQGISLQKREMMVGLKGGFGTVELGRLKSAYKYSGGVKYDPFVATALEARGRGGMSGKEGDGKAYGHNGFISDSFAYKNKFGNMSFWLTYDLDDGGSASAGSAFVGGAQGITAGLKFKAKSFEVGVALADDDKPAASNYSATKVFGQWKSGAHKISAQYEAIESGPTAEADILFVNYQLKMGKNVLVVSLGDTDVNAAGGNNDNEMTTVGFIHNFSKNTRVTAGYSAQDKRAASADSDVVSVGLRVKF